MNNSHTTYASAGIGGAVTLIIGWALKVFANIDMPADVSVSTGSVISTVTGYFLHRISQGEIK